MDVVRFSRLLGATVLAVLGAGPALAAVMSGPSPAGTACLDASLTFAGSSTDCLGIYEGNDANQDLDSLFGYDWDLRAKLDMPGGYEGDAGFGLTASGGTSGTWSLADWLGYGTAMIVLKGGPTFSAFLIADTGLDDALGGLFDTQSLLKGNGKRGPGLSHISLYTTGTPVTEPPSEPPVSPVPLPAAGFLLLGGLGALGALRRRA